MPKYRIGIDVGGTNTDAAILKCSDEDDAERNVLAWSKTQTTPDITNGIATALKSVLDQSNVSTNDILYLSIGTTHFLNAVVEADESRLSKIAVIRLAGPYTASCPPFIDFPPQLRSIIEGHSAIIDGGMEIDGKEILPINESQILEQCDIIRQKGITTVLITGVFSPLASANSQEEHVKKVILKNLGPNVDIVCSKDVGHVGLLERENAAILNSAILAFARRTVKAYKRVLERLSLDCPLFLTQFDGTLVSASVAAEVPIRTFSNGPTNSMRGASYLADVAKKLSKSVIVVDVGGTTTDIGVLLPSGLPRKAAAFTEVGGVRTSFSMPDVLSIGLGGGSRVRFQASGSVTVGPDSVGALIKESSISFGGDTLTATDLAVASGVVNDLGTPEGRKRASTSISQEQTDIGQASIRRMLESAIDRMKTDPDDVPLLLVGGGSILVPSRLAGISEIIRPPYFFVANAVGAAIARVSGTVDRVVIPSREESLERIVEACKVEAIGYATNSGAQKESIEIVEVTIIQLPYVANNASRVIIRAVGDLDFNSLNQQRFETDTGNKDDNSGVDEEVIRNTLEQGPKQGSKQLKTSIPPLQKTDVKIEDYKPSVSADGIWTISETDIKWLAEGCAVLGCGGGGATYSAFLVARQAVREGKLIRVVDADFVTDSSEYSQDTLIFPLGFMGSPSVSYERIASGGEIITACDYLRRYSGVEGKERAEFVISLEIGGKNGLEPLLLASRRYGSSMDCFVIDGDFMGRAYPKLDQTLPCVFKENGLYPVAAADGIGNCMLIPKARNNSTVEDVLRAGCTALGSSVGLALAPLRADELREHALTGTTSQAWRIGRAIALCRRSSEFSRIPEAIASLQGGQCLFTGKIVEVQRNVRGGFTHGRIVIAPLLQYEEEGSSYSSSSNEYSQNAHALLYVPFQNENLAAELVDTEGQRTTLCTVPDLISVLDAQSGAALGTQDYRYGLRVRVLGLACDPRWTTHSGLAIGGPAAFGFTTPYVPIATFCKPRSVIEEYRSSI